MLVLSTTEEERIYAKITASREMPREDKLREEFKVDSYGQQRNFKDL